MSADKNTGGPAFPCPAAKVGSPDRGYVETSQQEGMSLRDYFAAKAMQTIILANVPVGPDAGNENHRVAACAYAVADAMLKQREKP